MTLSALLICIGFGGLVLFGGFLALSACDSYGQSLRDRVREQYHAGGGRTRRARPEAAAAIDPRSLIAAWTRVRSRLTPSSDDERNLHQSRLLQAGVYNPAALSTFFLVKLGLMVGPIVVGLVLAATTKGDYRVIFLPACVLSICGMILPSYWLDRKIRARHYLLASGVPDLLDVMTVCLEGGLSLQGTLQRVGEELRAAHPVLAGELAIAQREIELGVSIQGALQRMADRTGFDGLRRMSSLVRESQKQGSELASALRLHSDTLRDQREAETEELAQKASVKILIPTLLFIFPAVFVVLAAPAAIRIHECFSQSQSITVRE